MLVRLEISNQAVMGKSEVFPWKLAGRKCSTVQPISNEVKQMSKMRYETERSEIRINSSMPAGRPWGTVQTINYLLAAGLCAPYSHEYMQVNNKYNTIRAVQWFNKP
jgi:hypothetical protein